MQWFPVVDNSGDITVKTLNHVLNPGEMEPSHKSMLSSCSGLHVLPILYLAIRCCEITIQAAYSALEECD